MGEFRGLLPDGGLPSRAMQQVEEIVEGMDLSTKPTIITSSTFSITTAGDYVAGVATTVTLDNGQSLPMQRGQAIVAVDVSGQLFYSDFITLAGPKPPSLTPGTLSATATQTEITATVTGAKDSESGLHTAPYRFSRDNGVSWTPWQSADSYTFVGLVAGRPYHLRAEVRNSLGEVASLSLPLSTEEDPNSWGTLYFDDFNDAPDGDITGRAFGSSVWESGDVYAHMLGLAGTDAGTAAVWQAPQSRFDLSLDIVTSFLRGASHLTFGWDGEYTDVNKQFPMPPAGGKMWRVHWGKDLANGDVALVEIANPSGSTSTSDWVSTTLASGTGAIAASSEGTVRVTQQNGLVTLYWNGTQILQHQIEDYVPRTHYQLSAFRHHDYPSVSLRSE